MEPDKLDMTSHAGRSILPYVSTIILSCWGGTVAHLTANKNKKFSPKLFFIDILVSAFAGILTHLLCNYAKINPEMSAVLIAVSGHMGTRAIVGLEILRNRVFGLPEIEVKK